MIALALVLGLLFAVLRLRARRRRVLAGLVNTAPTFSVAPPERSLIRRGEHRW